MKNVSELTPRKGKLYSTQLKIAKTFVISDSCNNLADKLNKTTLDFIKTQVNIQTVDLVSYLKCIFRSVNKTGLKIVATVCDQGEPIELQSII